MNQSEFDRFADEYLQLHAKNISVSGESPDFFAEYKIRDIAAELKARGVEPQHALDFGSGVGNSIPWMQQHLPSTQMTCGDVSERSLQVAANRFPGSARFVHLDGQTLPFTNAQFDLAYAMCVFHHIDHADHIKLLRELARVLSATGMLAVFEHNPYNPLTVQAVNTCEFDANAKLIAARQMKAACLAAGFTRVEVRYRIFFPRALARLRAFEKYMTRVPLGAQYSVFARKG